MNGFSACLALADGRIFWGYSVAAEGHSVGELVFNTAATGYQEIVSDPSYARQMVVLTTAHVGNTGVNSDDMESSRVWLSGLITRDASLCYSNYRANGSFFEWMKKQGVVVIAGVDTRALTQHVRQVGAIGACLTTDVSCTEAAIRLAQHAPDLSGLDLAKVVSRKTSERWYQGQGAWADESLPKRFHVVIFDFGVKHSICRILYDKGCHVTLVPAETSASQVLAMAPDGVFLSNGPGDPAACHYAIAAARDFLQSGVPMFGVCLGFQILGLACGAQTQKMRFGHHGANHPVIETRGMQRVLITSQNHGFAVDEASLPDELLVTHRSLFDDTLQGFMHRHQPAFGFQGHPEAGPGPRDALGLFDQFIQLMADYAPLKKDVYGN